jgi:Zn-dependent protease
MLFNLLPIPPLDGSKLLLSLLPRKLSGFGDFLEHYGPFILLALVLLDNFGGMNIFGTLFFGIQNFVLGMLT